MARNPLLSLLGSERGVNFFADYWERKFLFLEKCGLEDTKLLNEGDIDQFLSHNAISYPFVRLVKKGKEIPLPKYLRKPIDAEFRLLDNDKVISHYADGATIILQKAHLWIKGLAEFVQEAQQDFHFPVNCNVYMTPAQAKGFAPHFDTHDVFVLQIAGEKIWNLYDQPVRYALDEDSLTQMQSDQYLKIRPKKELIMKKGSLLYVPRGLVHDTFTGTSHSIHVTVGIFPPRGVDLLKRLTTVASNSEFFRKGILANGNKRPLKTFSEIALKTADSKIAKSREKVVADAIEENFKNSVLQLNKGRFADLLKLDLVNPDSQVYRRTELNVKLKKTPKIIQILFYTKCISFPLYVYESLRFILNQSSFRVKMVTGRLNDDAKVLLVKTLIREGLLTVSNHP